MIDHKELRRLALSATPGPWIACGDHRGGCSCGQVWSTTVDFPVATAFKGDPEVGFAPEVKPQANALYIAAASPSVVLALLDEVESLRKDAERYRWLRDQNSKTSEESKWMVALDGDYWDECWVGCDLDSAIDAAMQAKEEG